LTLLRNPHVLSFFPIQYFHERSIKRSIERAEEKLPKPKILLENTNRCNAQCLICPHKGMRREQGSMDIHLFKKIIDEARDFGVEQVQITGTGEPFLDRGLTDKIRYAKNSRIPIVYLFTNGSLLTEEISEEILDSGLDRMMISVADLVEESYARSMPPLKFTRITGNVLRFLVMKEQAGYSKPEVIISVRNPENSISKIKSIPLYTVLKDLADSVEITPKNYIHNWAGQHETTSAYQRYAQLVKRSPCLRLWKDMNIMWDGRVSLCCLDYEGSCILGDIKVGSLADIWEGHRLWEIRRLNAEGKFDQVSLCAKCLERTIWLG
jgi:MoaA/NifB/PqqE/SkfB family radical SAM enzyme